MVAHQRGSIRRKRLLRRQLRNTLTRARDILRGTKRRERRIRVQRAKVGLLRRDLGDIRRGLGSVVVGVLGEPRGVVDDLIGLLDGGHLVARVLHVLLGEDDVARRHERGVALEGREFGGCGRGFGLECRDDGCVVVGFFGELGGVGGEGGDLRELGDLLALGLGGDGLGGVAVVFGCGEAGEGEEDGGGELHFGGGGGFVGGGEVKLGILENGK